MNILALFVPNDDGTDRNPGFLDYRASSVHSGCACDVWMFNLDLAHMLKDIILNVPEASRFLFVAPNVTKTLQVIRSLSGRIFNVEMARFDLCLEFSERRRRGTGKNLSRGIVMPIMARTNELVKLFVIPDPARKMSTET